MSEQTKKNKSKKKKKLSASGRFRKSVRRFIRKAVRIMSYLYRLGTANVEHEGKKGWKILGLTSSYTGFISLVLVATMLIWFMLASNSVGVERESLIVTGLSDDFEGYKILFITDLNSRMLGEEQSTLIRELSNDKWNMVILGGDMVGKGGDPTAFYTLIEQLGTRKPIYFIAGDSDPSPILDAPRDNSSATLTLNEMVYADWVLGAMERGAVYLDTPVCVTKGKSKLWLFPDTFLNINVNEEYDEFKAEVNQESESYLEGIKKSAITLPLTTYRRNLLHKASDLISSVKADDLIIMVSHESPTDKQLISASAALSEEDAKNYFIGPDLVLCGHYCAGEWRLPLIGAIHVNSNILPRYGWFPDQSYVRGQRSVGSVIVYTSSGLSSNSNTMMHRLNNPPKASLITLTGELPASFID